MLKRLRNKLAVAIMFVGLLVMVEGCAATPRLPDPTVKYPIPPAALMEPPQKLKPIGEPVVSK